MYIRFIRPSLLFWGATALASVTACANQPLIQSAVLPILPAHLSHKTDGTHELVVNREGLVYSGILMSGRTHVHKGKGNHYVPEYFATVRASDGQEIVCKLPRLKIDASTRCAGTDGAQYQLQEQGQEPS